jgi:hypothetical protein
MSTDDLTETIEVEEEPAQEIQENKPRKGKLPPNEARARNLAKGREQRLKNLEAQRKRQIKREQEQQGGEEEDEDSDGEQLVYAPKKKATKVQLPLAQQFKVNKLEQDVALLLGSHNELKKHIKRMAKSAPIPIQSQPPVVNVNYPTQQSQPPPPDAVKIAEKMFLKF